MCQVAYQGASGVAWQLRIGIQRDDVLDRAENGGVADNLRKGRLRTAPEPCIELLQLAALALVSHPHPFGWIPLPRPVKQIEDARAIFVVGRVERLDRCARIREQGIIVGQILLGCVTEVRQQGKEQIGITIAEIADLQGLEKIINIVWPVEQGGNHHHGAVLIRNAFRKIQPWQGTWRQHQRNQLVHQRDSQRRDTDQAGERKKPDAPVTQLDFIENGKHPRGRQCREQKDRAEVKKQAETPAHSVDPQFPWQTETDHALQIRTSVIDQVVTDMRAAVMGARLRCRSLRENNSLACHRRFTVRAAPRQVFDDMPVAVARGEILAGVHACRVFTQGLFDDAERLDIIPPVRCADETQAADAVCNGNLIGRSRAAVHFRQLCCRHALIEQFLLDPGLNERHGRPLRLESCVKLLYKRRGQRHIGTGKFGQQMDQLFGFALGRREHAVGPGGGGVDILAPTGNAQANAAQVFQQRQLQHDRKSPQFAQFQRFSSLVGGDELGGIVAVDTAIHVRDQFQREVIDAGETRRGTVSQPRQLPAVATRQMPPRQRDLLFDEIEVVEQPGLCCHDPLFWRGGGSSHDVIRRQQNTLIVCQPWQQAIRPRMWVNFMLSGQRDRVTLQLFDAEKLRTQQLSIVVVTQRITCACH